MKKLVYALRFTGQASPGSDGGAVLLVSATAPGCGIVTTMENGVACDVTERAGAAAVFESTVAARGDGLFDESGTITFGDDGDSVMFTTIGEGQMEPSPEEGVQYGAARCGGGSTGARDGLLGRGALSRQIFRWIPREGW